MLIVGAGGLAKQLIELVIQHYEQEQIVCYDDIHKPDFFLNAFSVLKHVKEAVKYLNEVDRRFTLGLGGPLLREKMDHKFVNMGGELVGLTSKKAIVSHFNVSIDQGVCILDQCIIESCVQIGRGSLINLNCLITHDCSLGNYVEVSPGAKLLGGVIIGNHCFIGAGAVILPNIKIGNNCIVGAGAVVTKNLNDGEKVAGVPARHL